jgi:hypothetical protein
MTGEDNIPVDIGTEYFLNTSLERCRHISLASEKRFRLKEYSETNRVAK